MAKSLFQEEIQCLLLRDGSHLQRVQTDLLQDVIVMTVVVVAVVLEAADVTVAVAAVVAVAAAVADVLPDTKKLFFSFLAATGVLN
jgi:di/tricarboxylate transporter